MRQFGTITKMSQGIASNDGLTEPLPLDPRLIVQDAANLLQRLALQFYHFPEPKDPEELRAFRHQCGDTCLRASRDLSWTFPRVCDAMASLQQSQRSLVATQHSLKEATLENRSLRQRLLLYEAIERYRVQEFVEGESGTILLEQAAPE